MNSELSTLLRSKGLHVTVQRLAAFRAVRAAPHSTADDVAESVRAQLGSVSRQAVYDALGVLAEHGILRRVWTAGSPARYECRVGDNHHHLICRRCGMTVDVNCAVGTAPCLSPIDAAGFRVEEAEVVYWGVCPGCQRPGPHTQTDTGNATPDTPVVHPQSEDPS